jgi:hypothetical protein
VRILVIGPGRSATSWVAATLGSTADAGFLLEPDNPRMSAYGSKASIGLGMFPILDAGDAGPPALRRLWDVAFGAPVHYVRGQGRVVAWLHDGVPGAAVGRATELDHPTISARLRLAHAIAIPRHIEGSPRHRVVKTIRAPLMLEWLLANWSPSVVVCRRHPLDVLASRLSMGYEPVSAAARQRVVDVVEQRYGVPLPAGRLATFSWSVGAEMSALDDAVGAHPEFHVVDHEDLCDDAVGRFRALARDLDLAWTLDDEASVLASNQPGSGYQRNRVAADLPGAWRHRLSPEDAQSAAAVIARFPVGARYDLSVSRP